MKKKVPVSIDLSVAYAEGLDYLGGATIRDVAALSGLGRETVHQISRNKGDPKLSTLVAIADAFDLTVVQFLELAIVPESENEMKAKDGTTYDPVLALWISQKPNRKQQKETRDRKGKGA